MDFSGLIGELEYAGELTPFVPWLATAEVLHIGRNTNIWNGKYSSVFYMIMRKGVDVMDSKTIEKIKENYKKMEKNYVNQLFFRQHMEVRLDAIGKRFGKKCSSQL